MGRFTLSVEAEGPVLQEDKTTRDAFETLLDCIEALVPELSSMENGFVRNLLFRLEGDEQLDVMSSHGKTFTFKPSCIQVKGSDGKPFQVCWEEDRGAGHGNITLEPPRQQGEHPHARQQQEAGRETGRARGRREEGQQQQQEEEQQSLLPLSGDQRPDLELHELAGLAPFHVVLNNFKSISVKPSYLQPDVERGFVSEVSGNEVAGSVTFTWEANNCQLRDLGHEAAPEFYT